MSERETQAKLHLLFCAEIVLLVFVSSGCVFAHKGSGTEACKSGGVQRWTSLMCRCPLLFLPDSRCLGEPRGAGCGQDPRKVWLHAFCSPPPQLFKMRLLLLAFPAYSLTASHNFALRFFFCFFSPALKEN